MREAHAETPAQIRDLDRSLSLSSDLESRRTCLGIDPQFITLSGQIAEKEGAQIPADQKDHYKKVQKILSVDGNSELVRGHMGGLTQMITAKFMYDHPEASFTEAMDPKAFQEQKREAGLAVMEALEKANGDPPDMQPIAKIIGQGMKVVGSIDLKKETLRFLGEDPNLPEADALKVLRDPKNREKVVAFMNGQLKFTQATYQVLNIPGIKGIRSQVPYMDIDYSLDGPAGIEKALKKGSGGKDNPNLALFLEAIRKEVPQGVIEAYSTADSSIRLFSSARNIGQYMSGMTSPFGEPLKAAKQAVVFDTLLQGVAHGLKASDLEMYAMCLACNKIQPQSIGIQVNDPNIAEALTFQALPEEQSARLSAEIQRTKPQATSFREMARGAAAPTQPRPQVSTQGPSLTQGPPPVVPPSVSATVPLPQQPQPVPVQLTTPPPITQAPPPMQPSVSASVPLPTQPQSKPVQPTVTQVSPPPTSQPTVPKQDEPQTKSQPKTRRRSQSDPGPRPKRETEQSTPQRRERSWSIHSKKHAEKMGKLPDGMAPK